MVLSACRSQLVAKDVESFLPEIRKAIVEEIGHPRTLSKDGRDLTSAFYDKAGKPLENLEKIKERRYTFVSVRGDRSPYSIFVDVFIETKNKKGHYQVIDKDDARAQTILNNIQTRLHESRSRGNVIDDLRPY